jgi:hypothetical protein
VSLDALVQIAIAVLTAIGTASGIVKWVVGRLDAAEEKREAAMERERKERIADREMFFNAYREERDARETFFRAIEKDRQQDRHDLRDEMQGTANSLHLFQQQVSRDHPTYERLGDVMKPLAEAVESMRTEMRASLDRVFEKLDGKADKSTRPVGH